MSQPVRLVYDGWLPNPHTTHWQPRYRLRQRALKVFGIMPWPATRFAHVTLVRVLGARQRLMDDDKLAWQLRGLRDSLTNKHGGYIVDDSPAWARFNYQQDETRRAKGPKIEVVIVYKGEGELSHGPIL